MGTSILMTSGKGGTGKTTCCAALASHLAGLGHKTICVDCDAALRNLDLVLGLSERVLWDFMDVLCGRVSAMDAATAHPKIKNLWFLSAPTALVSDSEAAGFRSLMQELRAEFDYVLLDCPAGIGGGFRLAASGADMAVIVSTGDLTSLRDGQRAAAELRGMGVENIRLLVNRVRVRAYRRVRRNIDEIIDTVGARLLGVIREDDRVAEAGNLEIPLTLYKARRVNRQFSRVARRIAGEKVPLGRI